MCVYLHAFTLQLLVYEQLGWERVKCSRNESFLLFLLSIQCLFIVVRKSSQTFWSALLFGHGILQRAVGERSKLEYLSLVIITSTFSLHYLVIFTRQPSTSCGTQGRFPVTDAGSMMRRWMGHPSVDHAKKKLWSVKSKTRGMWWPHNQLSYIMLCSSSWYFIFIKVLVHWLYCICTFILITRIYLLTWYGLYHSSKEFTILKICVQLDVLSNVHI